MTDRLKKLREISSVSSIRRLGLEQYTTPVILKIYLGGRISIDEDRDHALNLARRNLMSEGIYPTHFMASSEHFKEGRHRIYSFVFYGPPKRKRT
ncbi:hypothetical protein A3K73_09460 [Candidatus Pacearchaeota archaeon RBG_13_36_9]|nr:MAG: hypothetical protein A3K73_09460 [Candidatus Pacearchaeota archaeon RBG_13_36_9]